MQQQKFIELVRQNKVEEAIEFAQDELAQRVEETVLRALTNTFQSVSRCVCVPSCMCVCGLMCTSVMQPSLLPDLERAMTLLAFDAPAASPVADLLDTAQRQKTASELNAAILVQLEQEQGSCSGICLCSRVWL